MHPPPTNLNLTISAEKSVSISVKTFSFFFFFFWRPPDFGRKKRLNLRKISLNFGEDLFFFGDHLNVGGKNIRVSDSGRKISLHFNEDIRIFEVLCSKFLKSPPTKIFWIRHWLLFEILCVVGNPCKISRRKKPF